MESYKELHSIEDAFREIESFLDIRPIHYWKDRRVRGHVFECVLTYLTEALIGKLVSHQSARETIQELRKIRVVKLATRECEGMFLRELTESDRTIFKSLRVPMPRKIVEL